MVVGGGYCRLQMPLKPALTVRGTVAGHRLGALGATSPPPLSNASLWGGRLCAGLCGTGTDSNSASTSAGNSGNRVSRDTRPQVIRALRGLS